MIYFSHLIDFFRGWGKKGILEECMYKKISILKTNREDLFSRQFTERPYQTLSFEYFIYLFTEHFSRR